MSETTQNTENEMVNPDVQVSDAPTTGLTFGEALELVKRGILITRAGWNGKGMFIFARPEDTIPASVFPAIKSLPQAVKDYFTAKATPVPPPESKEKHKPVYVKFTSYLCMKAADDTIVNGWLASQTDMLAEDWMIFEGPRPEHGIS